VLPHTANEPASLVVLLKHEVPATLDAREATDHNDADEA
jgi:hypothetical protein